MLPDRYAYHRLETDDEFVERIKKKHPRLNYRGYYGETLDNLVWSEIKMQRKIIFVPV